MWGIAEEHCIGLNGEVLGHAVVIRQYDIAKSAWLACQARQRLCASLSALNVGCTALHICWPGWILSGILCMFNARHWERLSTSLSSMHRSVWHPGNPGPHLTTAADLGPNPQQKANEKPCKLKLFRSLYWCGAGSTLAQAHQLAVFLLIHKCGRFTSGCLLCLNDLRLCARLAARVSSRHTSYLLACMGLFGVYLHGDFMTLAATS